MSNVPEKKKDLPYGTKFKENCSIDFQEARLEENSNTKTRDDERRRLEKWKIGRKNFS